MQDSRIRYKEFVRPASKPVALYFMQRKTAVSKWVKLNIKPHPASGFLLFSKERD